MEANSQRFESPAWREDISLWTGTALRGKELQREERPNTPQNMRGDTKKPPKILQKRKNGQTKKVVEEKEEAKIWGYLYNQIYHPK